MPNSSPTKRLLRRALPLWARRRLAALIGRQVWLRTRYWWTLELLRDFAEADPEGFHRFLWSHHLAYAESYEAERRFGAEKVHPVRRMLFADIGAAMKARGIVPEREVTSVFEVGCSLGYLLRDLETGLFRGALVFEGNDIDGHAIASGSEYLRRMESKVRLHHADMADLDRVMGSRYFDVTFAAGVLMYLQEEAAALVVRTILRHTGRLAAFAGLAHPKQDNRELPRPEVRERDGTFIHNIDRLVERAGGRVIFRRWEGDRQVKGNTIYFVLAEPSHEP